MKKELLFSITKKDFIIEPYRGSGPGGQHRNKTMSCVRIRHPDSSAMAVGTETREQNKNKILAFNRLVYSNKFQTWLRKKVVEYSIDYDYFYKQIENSVNEWMKPENLKIE